MDRVHQSHHLCPSMDCGTSISSGNLLADITELEIEAATARNR